MITDARFIFLGTGTSSGLPVIGCECATCTSDDPRDNRLRCGACLQFIDHAGQERAILIDTSPDLRQQALRHNLRRCDGILFTHAHVDHVFGLDEVRRFNVLMDAPIDVWADARTMQALFRVYQHIFRREQNTHDSFVAWLVPQLIEEPLAPVDLHGLRATPVRLLHGGTPVLGFRLEALDEDGDIATEQPDPLPLAYCTDVSAIPPESWPKLTGLRTLILDMLRPRHHPTHFSVDEAITVAGRVGASRTRFIHMTHEILHADLDPKLPNTMALAYDGLVLGPTT